MQKRILDRVVGSLNEGLDGHLEYGSIRIVPFNTLVIEDAAIVDDNPYTEDEFGRGWGTVDTLAKAERITAVFTLRSLFSDHGADISRAVIDGGEFNLVTEPDERFNCNLARIFHLPKPKELPESAPDIFRIRRVRLNNFHYTLRSFLPGNGHMHSGIGINWEDLDLYTDLEVHNLMMSDLIMSGIVDRMRISEKCGYEILDISGKAVVGRGKTTVTDLKFRDNWSDVQIPLFGMSYLNSRVFKYFLSEVSLEGVLAESRLSSRTLEYFAGTELGDDTVLDIRSGIVRGPVNNLTVEGLDFSDSRDRASGRISVHISGLPDISRTDFDFDGKDITFTTKGLNSIIKDFSGGKGIEGLDKIASGKKFNLQAKIGGSPEDIKASIKAMLTGSGPLEADARIRNLPGGGALSVEASASANSLEIGELIGTGIIGRASFNLAGSAEFRRGKPSILLDSLSVGSIGLMGYDYKDIYAKGGFSNGVPHGAVVVNDPNLKVLISGKDLQYSMDVAHADLRELNLDRRGERSGLSFYMDTKIDTTSGLAALIDIHDLILQNDEGKHDIGRIRVNARRGRGGDVISLRSSFADADMSASGNITDFVKDIQYATSRRDLYALYNDIPENRASKDYGIKLNLYDTRELLSFLKPDLYIADRTSFDLNLVGGRLGTSLNSQRIALGDRYLKDVMMSGDNAGGKLNLLLEAGELMLGGINLNDTRLSSYADDNNVGINFGFYAEGEGKSDISLSGELARNDNDTLSINARLEDSHLAFGQRIWTISPARLGYDGGRFYAENLEIYSGDQSIVIEGGVDLESKDELMLRIGNLDMSIADSFVKKNIGLEGLVSGKAVLISPVKERLELMMNFSSDSMSVAGNPVGSFKIGSFWDDSNQKLNCLVQNFFDGNRTVDARAFFSPADRSIGGSADLNGMRLSILSPFLQEIFSGIDGSLSGKLLCGGSLDSLSIYGENTRIDTMGLRVAFTNVTYTVDGPFSVSGNGLSLNNLSITDDNEGKGRISGSLKNIFREPELDIRTSLERMRVLNATDDDNENVYGHLSTSGDIAVNGPLDRLHIDAAINTFGPGEVHVTAGSALDQGKSELLTFYVPEVAIKDPYEEMRMKRVKAEASKANLTARAHVNVSPEVFAFVEIDKSSGNVMSANGTGNFDLDFNLAQKQFQLNGDYDIAGGNYHFAIPGIVGKDLSISEGSSIKFGGDLMDSQIDINAVYSTRTSLSNLTADTTSVATRRLVNCGLNISDRLRNPKIGFSIDIPDLDPVTKSQVQGALNTEDKLQKQFISLLLFGSFLPSESSGIVNNSANMLYANVAEIMAGQVNNILQRLEIPLDLGFGYQQNDGGTDIFDVAVSTQLFNNRVVVGGSVGNRQYSTSTSANGDVVGDLDIEVKLNKSGQIRLKLFSHSADEYTSYLDFTQRNGAGITYQKEYNRLKELFTKRKADADERKRTIHITE